MVGCLIIHSCFLIMKLYRKVGKNILIRVNQILFHSIFK